MQTGIDINCDMGEGFPLDEELMPFVNSVNIACGFHAGRGETMRQTVLLALKYGNRIGAHPSFFDREHFGRREMQLPSQKLYAIVLEQLIRLDQIARENGAHLSHVKPHGALYNMASRDENIATVIATAIKDFDESLELYGQSGSKLVEAGRTLGLVCRNEVFADRTYQENGSLTSRSEEGALIESTEDCIRQVIQMIEQRKVRTLQGTVISVVPETICIHGDGPHALAFARAIHAHVSKTNV